MVNLQISDTLANSMLNGGAGSGLALANGGQIKLYTASQPANANTAVSSQTLLATLGLSATAFGAAAAGSATANAVTSATAAASGTATWGRVLKSDGTTVLFDFSVGVQQSISAATNANGVRFTCNGHGLTTGQKVGLTGFTGNWAPCNGNWVVTMIDANTFSIPVDSTSFGAMSGTPLTNFDYNMNSNVISSGATVAMSSLIFALLEAGF